MSGIPIAARRGGAIGLAVLLACGAPGLAYADSDTGLAVTTGVSLPAQAQGKPPAWSGKAFRQVVTGDTGFRWYGWSCWGRFLRSCTATRWA